ncbi:hypothetical protein GW17_00001132 [Ensete ventricosum]|nr:hypothetical protein GW17_00001132 [Ensete ventricosum]
MNVFGIRLKQSCHSLFDVLIFLQVVDVDNIRQKVTVKLIPRVDLQTLANKLTIIIFSVAQIRVFADHVVESSEITTGVTRVGDYELHDLVLLESLILVALLAGGENEGNWYMPDIFVNVVKPGGDSHVGIVREVLMQLVHLQDGSCKVALGSAGNGETLTIGSSDLEVVRPKKSDKIKIMNGTLRGVTGKLIGIDGSDGIVKLDDTYEVKILDMVILAKLATK